MDDPDDCEHTAHMSWLILRHCATAALSFDMRILGKEHVLMAAQEVDAEILKTLAKILRHDASTPIPDRATKQLYLPAWLGGGGIRRQEDLIDCLFVSAAMQIWPIIAARLRGQATEEQHWSAVGDDHLAEAANRLRE